MQMKLISNDLLSLTHNIQQSKAALQNESLDYSEKLQDLLNEFKEINAEKTAQYRSVVQSWLATFESCLRSDLSSVESHDASEPSTNNFGRSQITNSIIGIIKDSKGEKLKDFWNKTFKKESSQLRRQKTGLEERLGDFGRYLESLSLIHI